MANNQMFLIHKPTKLGIMLGKRMAWGWYGEPEASELRRFYDYLQDLPDTSEETLDDFILAMEDCSKSGCFEDWNYTGKSIDGFPLFIFQKKPSVKMVKN